MVFGLVCGVSDFGWLILGLLIDVLRVLVLGGSGCVGLYRLFLGVVLECVDWCLFLGCVLCGCLFGFWFWLLRRFVVCG